MLFYDQANGRKQYVGTGKGNGEVEKGSVIFKITGDGKELYNSGIMRGGETARAISLPCRRNQDPGTGSRRVQMMGLSGDHADWLEAVISYFEIRPSLVAPEYQGEIASMSKEVERSLQQKIGQLETVCLPLPSPSYDWLICNQEAKATGLSGKPRKRYRIEQWTGQSCIPYFPKPGDSRYPKSDDRREYAACREQ